MRLRKHLTPGFIEMRPGYARFDYDHHEAWVSIRAWHLMSNVALPVMNFTTARDIAEQHWLLVGGTGDSTMKRAVALDPANTCTHCPHEVINLGRKLYCPCEDCHVGGLIQGREPFALTTHYVRASEANVGTTVQPSAPPTEEAPLWVDPIHSLD